ncbi:MAG: histidine kinase [Anaerolineae bacterium]|jgi:signal transduction histidine kinase
MRRWLRSLQAQLFLWAILPVTFVIIALAFTGVYTHQQAMRDFAAERDLAQARLVARLVEDGLMHGGIAPDGSGLTAWLAPLVADLPASVGVVDGEGRVLSPDDLPSTGARLMANPDVAAALSAREGFVVVSEGLEAPTLVSFSLVVGTDWRVLIWEPVDDLIGPILRLSSLAPIVAVGAGVLSLLVLTFGWRTIVRPLQRLAQAAEQVSWGDRSAVSEPVGGVQEVRDLHQAMNDMVDRIEGYEVGMRDYLGAVTQGQEAERARVARELHDGPVQELIALGQRAEMARRLLERGEIREAQRLLDELRGAGTETLGELRRLIGALRPVYLEDLGFLPALEMLVREMDRRTTARVRLERGDNLPRLASQVELSAYRVAQEALTNAVRHAEANVITVRVDYDGDELVLAVEDDGAGFELPPRPDLLTRAGHFGLVGMQERVTRMGGTLRIRTAPGAGTRIFIRLPGHPPAG